MAICGSALQAVEWLDDFNDGNAEDGNPVTWITNPLGALPGTYDASSGDFVIMPPVGGGGDDNVAAYVDVNFSTTYSRTQGVIQQGPNPGEDGGNVGLLTRLNPNTLSGYGALLDQGGLLLLLKIEFGAPTTLNTANNFGVDAATDFVMEFNAVGSQLDLFVWRPGDTKPATPTLSATDSSFTSGVVGVLYNEDDDNTAGVHRYVTARDTPFVDLTPGDFNDDGKVDAADYATWRDDLGGDLQVADYDAWRANFGAGSGSGTAATSVPEPTGLVWSLIAAISLMLCRNWRAR